jgi:hypothetical protein
LKNLDEHISHYLNPFPQQKMQTMLVPAWKPVPLQWVHRSLNMVLVVQASVVTNSSWMTIFRFMGILLMGF